MGGKVGRSQFLSAASWPHSRLGGPHVTAWRPWKALRTAARLSIPAWCSAEPASSPYPLGHSLPSRLM
jgi:hypothetical protein